MVANVCLLTAKTELYEKLRDGRAGNKQLAKEWESGSVSASALLDDCFDNRFASRSSAKKHLLSIKKRNRLACLFAESIKFDLANNEIKWFFSDE